MFFIVTMIVAISPLISRYCINGHDLEYHLLRIESLKEGILIGRPFLKANTLFFGGAGYASSMFYSDLFMHIPALLRVFHVSIGKSFHIYTAMIFVLCYLSTFYCVWKMSLSKFAGTVAAILLTLCPYHMDDMLVRTACGENAAFIFLPFAVYGIFNLLFEEMDKPWVFGIGYGGLILTHPATCFITVGFGVVMILIYIRKFIKEPRLIAKLCVISGLTALVTSFQWLPMLEQFADDTFYVSNNWTDLLDSAVGFAEIASSSFPCVGFILIGLVFPRLFLSRKDYPILGFVDLLICAAFVFAIGATNIMPWERVGRFFGFLQFPWRLFIMSSVFLAMADAIVLKLFLDRFPAEIKVISLEISLIIITAVMSMMAIDHQNENSMGYYDYSDDYYSYKPYTGNVIAGEWLPKAVSNVEDLIGQSDEMVFSDGTQGDFTREGAKVIAKIDKSYDYVDVPFLYYKGYSAVIVDDAGGKTKLEVSGEGKNGMCRVELSGAKGTLTVTYRGTIIQYISYIVSALFLILIIDLCYLKNKYKKKLKARAAAAGANLGKIACIAVLAMSAFGLAGCSAADMQYTANRLGQLGKAASDNDEGYKDPDSMINYLKEKNGTEESDDDISEDGLIKVNLCRKGYDSNANGYAVVIDESSGEQVISVVTPEQAAQIISVEVPVEDGLYNKLLKEEIDKVRSVYKTDTLKQRVMYETDALLCLEVFPDKDDNNKITELAVQLAEDILDIPAAKIENTLDKYDCAAALSKASYVMRDWERAKEAGDVAEQYFKDAELAADQEGEPVAARLWAAAELYRLTGQKTYRSVVDAIAMDVVPEGFSYEEPGYYGLFAYLMSPYPTNYNVCTSMMNLAFSKANSLIKEPVDVIFQDTRVDDSTVRNDEKNAVQMLDNMFLVTMTNYVSVSVEYKGYVQDRLHYIFGANLSGIDFTEDEQILCDAPKLFVLEGLSR